MGSSHYLSTGGVQNILLINPEGEYVTGGMRLFSLQDSDMIAWRWCIFQELGRDEIYEILRVRQEVFTVEQKCAYQDADGLDQSALHLIGWRERADGRQLVAYLRVLPPGSRFSEPSIGRLLTIHSMRGAGIGRTAMLEAIRKITDLFPGNGIRISAQKYLENFYQDLGFIADSADYEEDGIPHRQMVRSLP